MRADFNETYITVCESEQEQEYKMLKFSIIFGFLASIAWRTTPTNCNQTTISNHSVNMNEILTRNILNYMDTSARPCENFYQYACGHWYQQYIDEYGFSDTLEMLDYELNKKLQHVLRKHNNATMEHSEMQDDSIESEGPNDIYQKSRIYYKSCKRVKPYNLKKYLQLVPPSADATWYSISHNRPAGMRQWEPNNFNWLMTIANLRRYGLNGVLLKEDILPRWDYSLNNSIYLDKPNLSDTQPIASWPAWVEMLLDIGQTKRVANEIARDVHNFELQLHKLQEIEDEEGVKEMRLTYLQEYLPQIDWLNYLQLVKGPTLDPQITIIIRNIPYMRALVKLLNGAETETVCNYIMLKFVQFLKQRGPAEISKQECMTSLRRAMPLALSHIVGEHYFKDSKHNERLVRRVFMQLKQQFQHTLSDNRLQLSQPVLEMLLEKIKIMRLQIGNTPHNVSIGYLESYYANVTLDPHNFYMNQLALLRLAVQKSHDSLDVALTNNSEFYILHEEWLGGGSSSPYYVKPRNLIVVPYGFLQMPIYQRQLLDIYKYSVLGFALAHELVHGFDSSGIDYDSVGNIMGPSEDITANQRFIQGLRCMQNEPFGKELRKLNEKLADYEGLRLVFHTYFNGSHAANHTKQFQLHDTSAMLLNQFTEQQVFFLNFAQFFCGKEHRNIQQKALDELRVLQMFSNFEQFSIAFNCNKRTKVRCRLWL